MGGKILVIDNDPNALRLVGYTLEVEGYEIATAETGSEALAAAEREPPDLVILDVMMPDMSGIEVCQRLRANPRTAHLPILMLSAKGKVEDRVKGLRAGGDDYVPKPVDPTELVARVEALILRAARAIPPSAEGRFLGFVGAKGGVGTTTVAVNVAVAVAETGKRTILADFHPYLGTVCGLLGLDALHSLAELARMDADRIRPEDIERRLIRHSRGLQVLASDQSPPSEEHRELTPSHTEAILEGLSILADYIILDLPVDLAPMGPVVLSRCDFVTLITEPDPVALRCAKGRLALLRQWGIMGELVGVVVVNRFSPAMTMTIVELQDLLGAAIVGMIPPASEACLYSLRQGAPLLTTRPDHLTARVLQQLAERLVAEHPTASPH